MTTFPRLLRVGVSYLARDDGPNNVLLPQNRLALTTSRGADLLPGSPITHDDALTSDFLTGLGFVGEQPPEFIDAQPMRFAEQKARTTPLATAESEVDATVQR